MNKPDVGDFAHISRSTPDLRQIATGVSGRPEPAISCASAGLRLTWQQCTGDKHQRRRLRDDPGCNGSHHGVARFGELIKAYIAARYHREEGDVDRLTSRR